MRRTPSGLSCYAWSRRDRAGRLLNPEDGGALPAGDYPPAGTRRSSAASPCGPAGSSHRRGALSRGVSESSRDSPITPGTGWLPAQSREPPRVPAGLLLARRPRMERDRLRLLPRASHPAVTRDARRGGDRPSRTDPSTTPSTSVEPQRCLPLSLMHPHFAPNHKLLRAPPRGQRQPPGAAVPTRPDR